MLAQVAEAPRSRAMENVARLDADTAWAAFMRRDRAWDGRIVGAVKTTGIYCRPVCTVRTPRLSSCAFFASAAAAEAAGFRPCLRCRPAYAVMMSRPRTVKAQMTAIARAMISTAQNG